MRDSEGRRLDLSGYSPVDLRNFSVKCGHCDSYQTLSGYRRRGDWNVYVYECENDTCDPALSRTLIEIPIELDEFARRDPEWHGGQRHAGADGSRDS